MSNSASEGKTDEKEKNKGGRGRREEEKRPYHLSAKGQQKYQLEKLMAEPVCNLSSSSITMGFSSLLFIGQTSRSTRHEA